MKKIAVYCEINSLNDELKDVSYELISKAFELKQSAKEKYNADFKIEAIAIGKSLDIGSIRSAVASGADKVTLIKDKSLNIFSQTVYSQAFVEYFEQNKNDFIIFPATLEGRILAPRITTLLDTGLVADCTGLEIIEKKNEKSSEIKLASTRPTFGAELMATILSKKSPECATVRPKVFEAKFLQNADDFMEKYSEYELKYPLEETRAKLIRSLFDKDASNNIDFSKAKIILAAGYGLYTGKDAEYYKKIEKLADKIKAQVGATRKVTDLNLLAKEFQIGQTGSTVAPELYIAFGISGAIQHVSGMKNSKTIIAINTDENADIFKYSDYKIVADAKKIIDELLEYLK